MIKELNGFDIEELIRKKTRKVSTCGEQSLQSSTFDM
jgi:hypothetical protein